MRKSINHIAFLLLTALPLLAACHDDPASDNVNAVKHIYVTNATNNVITIDTTDELTVQVSAKYEDESDAGQVDYIFSSSDGKVFTVSETGVITGTGAGEAALKVSAADNTDIWTICTIRVNEKIYRVTDIDFEENLREYWTETGNSINVANSVIVYPANATNPTVIFSSSDEMIANIDEYGTINTYSIGSATIYATAVDGSGVVGTMTVNVSTVSYQDMDRTGWSVTTGDPYFLDGVQGSPDRLIDNDLTTHMAIVKPNKKDKVINGGRPAITTGSEVYFTVDLGQEQQFSYFMLRHRVSGNTTDNLRIHKANILGSNTGLDDDFTTIMEGAVFKVKHAVIPDGREYIRLPETVSYRYLRIVVPSDGVSASGDTLQASDFQVGTYTYDPIDE